MKPVVAIFDDFFRSPDEVFDIVAGGTFENYQSIWDGVSYPGINKALPEMLQAFIRSRIEHMLSKEIKMEACFSRVMLRGMVAPHRIHSDRIMGQSSMHIYLSKKWPTDGGTAFWTHKTQGHKHTAQTNETVVANDHDKLEHWTRDMLVVAKFNRAVLHDSTLFHSAEPGYGWGETPQDGRLVITTFFSEVL